MANRIRVLTVIGTRPEAIKMAPVLLGMAGQPDRFAPVLCVTGQHRSMLDQVLRTFRLSADYDLDVMTENQKLSSLLSKVVAGVGSVISDLRPDVVFVQGDTTTTLAAALAACYERVPVAHVEAGLRTGDIGQPFPEEANRVLTDRISSYCFAPTALNRDNLLREGVCPCRIRVTGNTAIDALLAVRDKVMGAEPDTWGEHWGSARDAVADHARNIVLITAHRRENFGEGMRLIFEALLELSRHFRDWDFVYPVHLNPNVKGCAESLLSGAANIHLIEPLDYEPFVYLMNRSRLILTDSGGIQEEAPSLGKPVIVMREKTERQEAVEAGTVILTGPNKEKIKSTVRRIIETPGAYHEAGGRPNPYGDGTASRQILEFVWDRWQRDGQFGACC